MEPSNTLWMTISVIVLCAIILGSYYVRQRLRSNPWADKSLLDKGMDLPVIWLYYDTSQVNSRHWLDFGARSSRVLNMPFMNLCYETIVRANGDLYRVEVIGGLNGLKERFSDDELPIKLRNTLATVGPAEKAWMRTAVLAKFGGLWLEPSTIALKGFGALPNDTIVFFGTDLGETYSGTGGTATPGNRAIWVPYKGHPLVVEHERAIRRRLDNSNGGTQVRGDDNWDFAAFYAERPKVEVRPMAELARKGSSGRVLQVEDILASGQEGRLHFDIPAEAIYVALPFEDIERRRAYGWFLRLSEKQILESDLAITKLLKLTLGK